jgi:hypothetical protein
MPAIVPVIPTYIVVIPAYKPDENRGDPVREAFF